MKRKNKMRFLKIAFALLVLLLQGCSFQNDFQKSQVRFEGVAEKVDSVSFEVASVYDYVCLTYKGGGGIQRTRWVEIDKSGNSLSAEFEIPNLLGGYEYQFKLVGLDKDIVGTKPLSEPCPVVRPSKPGWARLGYLKTRVSVNAKSLDLTIPFAFNDGPEAEEDVLPGQPTSLSVSPGNQSAVLSWTAMLDGGITDYVIQYSSDSGHNWTIFTDGKSTSTTATVTGLRNGTAYVFRVTAINSNGIGLVSAISSSVTPTDITPEDPEDSEDPKDSPNPRNPLETP